LEHISTTTLIVILIVMVMISAYFSGSETGMMTLNRYACATWRARETAPPAA
jgi:Mg2+/Co2+ transporter CorB